MDYDISQSVPQGGFGTQDAENRRIEAITDELRRRCELYEAQHGDSQPHVTPFEVEQRVTEAFAKEKGLWLPITRYPNWELLVRAETRTTLTFLMTLSTK